MLDLQLPNPEDVVPEGVKVAVRHFLRVSKPSEEGELETHACVHAIVKIEGRDGISIEVIDRFKTVTPQFFETDKFQKGRFCYVAVAWLPWLSKEKCHHSFLKEIVITRDVMKCPHEPNALSLHCVCGSMRDEFKKKMRERGQVITNVIMDQYIEKSSSSVYQISVKLNEHWESGRKISHLELCKYLGQRQLGGTIKERFLCICEEEHCLRSKQISLRVHEVSEEKIGEENEFDTSLSCLRQLQHTIPDITQDNVPVQIRYKTRYYPILPALVAIAGGALLTLWNERAGAIMMAVGLLALTLDMVRRQRNSARDSEDHIPVEASDLRLYDLLKVEVRKPHRGHDFLENLAYELNFGEDFETYLRELNPGTNPDKKVRSITINIFR